MGSRLMLVLAASGVVALASPAFAQSAADKETARSLMDQGLELRDKKDYKAALERLEAADQIMHVPTTALEVARTQEALGLLVECRDTLARVISSIPSPREPQQFKDARKAAQALDDSLEARVPALTIRVSGAPAGTTPSLVIDSVAVPSAVIGLPRRLNAGHHVLVATTSNSEGREELDINEGEKKEVTITLAPVAHPTPPPPEPVAPTPQPAAPTAPVEGHRSYLLPAIAFGVGGAGLVIGGVTGLLMLSKQSDLTASCPNRVCGPSRYGDLDTANMFATISTVSFIVGGVGVAVGVIALLVGKPSAPEPAPATARVVPWVGPGSAGLSGSF
jgi:hypothetical protein